MGSNPTASVIVAQFYFLGCIQGRSNTEPMPETVRAKLLLGWMNQHEAVNALNSCIFDPPLTKKKSIALWRQYYEKVQHLPPRTMALPAQLALTQEEQAAVDEHIRCVKSGPTAYCFDKVAKIDPTLLVARQYYVVTERAEQYAQEMAEDKVRIDRCLGNGMSFTGTLVAKQVSPKLFTVDLPHMEFVAAFGPAGPQFIEQARYIAAVVPPSQDRIVLWAGYHQYRVGDSHLLIGGCVLNKNWSWAAGNFLPNDAKGRSG